MVTVALAVLESTMDISPTTSPGVILAMMSSASPVMISLTTNLPLAKKIANHISFLLQERGSFSGRKSIGQYCKAY